MTRYARGLVLLLSPQLVIACHCLISSSACQDASNSSVVFAGTVEAIQPSLLDRWAASPRSKPFESPEILALRKDNSASGLRILEDRYLALLFDLPPEEKIRVQTATSQKELQAVLALIIDQGTKVRFRVKTIYQKKLDADDDPKNGAEDDATPKSIEVWNGVGDCGIRFQKGETYLVYATDDEASEHLQTSVCHRTTRLTDAGEDLTYLYFLQNGGVNSNRLEGFVTSQIEQLQQDAFHYTGKVKAPVSDVVVELKSEKEARYTEPDPDGRFVFDGLTAGDYSVSVFERGFPDRVERLSGPRVVHLESGKCAVTALPVLVRGLRR